MLRFMFTLILLVLVSAANAGGRGGHTTTFDPNLYGGGWKNIITDFGATCNGVASDATAWASWITFGQAQGQALAKLFIPPGSKCVLPANQALCADLSVHDMDTGIKNCLIWAYGAQIQQWTIIGGWAFYNDDLHEALINATTAGDSAVTVNDGNVGRFTVGRWVGVGCFNSQDFGFPASHNVMEYRLITAINVNVISLSSTLANSCKATYPSVTGSTPIGGPAMIYLMEPTFNTNTQVLGLSILMPTPSGTAIQGRNVIVQDVSAIGSGFSFAMSKSIWFIGSNAASGTEIDKEIENVSWVRSQAVNVQIQGATTQNVLFDSVTLNGLNGTGQNAVIRNSKFNNLIAGPACCGHGNALTLDGVSVQNVPVNYHHTLLSSYSFSVGTFTIAKSNGEYAGGSVSLWVPSYKYFFGDIDGSNTCTSSNTFTVIDVVDAGSNVNIVTDLASVPVGNICGGGRMPSTMGAYQAMSLVQKFSGPANLLSNPEMLPP